VTPPHPTTHEACWSEWPLTEALRLRTVLLRPAADASAPWVALTEGDPHDLLVRAVSRRAHPHALRWITGEPAEIERWLSQGESQYSALGGEVGAGGAHDEGASAGAYELSIPSIEAQTHPVLRLLDATLFDSLKAEASDVHFENDAGGMQIRQRMDGVMRPIGRIATREAAQQLVSRLKVLAELDIGETRLPQDGSFKLRVGPREVDFRLSVMPTAFGEDAVVRVLDGTRLNTARASLRLESLGLPPADCAAIRALASQPYGMLVVTGPTGSGKTTTLYSVIGEINRGLDKIVTIEDPIEYQLEGVVQIPVNEKKGLTFARGLRSILRHDPDRVMVGEIRDAETAQIATQAALTGHMVLTTIHASNALDVVGRLMHMGLDLYNLVSALHGIVAQRLLRRVCPHCAEASDPPAAELVDLGPVAAGDLGQSPPQWRSARGCARCFGSGYRGRRAVSEIVRMDDDLRDLIASRAPMRVIKDHARRSGARSLRAAALAAACDGHTTLEEVRRVTLAD
jgi:general secretion pathway protein E